MKKIVSVLIVLVLFTGSAFADVGVGAWGRAAFTPLKYITAEQANGTVVKDPVTGDDVEGESYVYTRTTWGGGIRVGVSLSGWSDYVGFNLDINGDDVWNIGAGDFVSIWAKPFSSDILKLTVGKFNEDVLRGKIGQFTSSDINDLYFGGKGNDDIFNRFQAWKGFLISSAPIDGLFIGLLVKNDSADFLAPVAYRKMQIGAGYNISGIGHVRAQYIGGWSGTYDLNSKDDMKYFTPPVTNAAGKIDWKDADDPSRIEFAFALTAVENLLVDMGFKYFLPVTVTGSGSEVKKSNGAQIALGVKYNIDAIGIGARFDMKGLGSGVTATGGYESKDGIETAIRLTPSYNLGVAAIGLDFGATFVGESTDGNGTGQKDQWSQMGFGAYVSKGLGNGQITAGVGYTLPKYGEDGANGSGVFQIPIILEYWF